MRNRNNVQIWVLLKKIQRQTTPSTTKIKNSHSITNSSSFAIHLQSSFLSNVLPTEQQIETTAYEIFASWRKETSAILEPTPERKQKELSRQLVMLFRRNVGVNGQRSKLESFDEIHFVFEIGLC